MSASEQRGCIDAIPSRHPAQLAGDESGEGALISGGAVQKLVALVKPKGPTARPVPLQTAQAAASVLSLLCYTGRGAEIACDAGAPAAMAAVLARCTPAGRPGEGPSEEDEAAGVVSRFLTTMATIGGRPAEMVVSALAAEVRKGGAAAAGGRGGSVAPSPAASGGSGDGGGGRFAGVAASAAAASTPPP